MVLLLKARIRIEIRNRTVRNNGLIVYYHDVVDIKAWNSQMNQQISVVLFSKYWKLVMTYADDNV